MKKSSALPMIYFSYFGTVPPSYYEIRYQYVPGTWPLEWPPPADEVPASAPRKILAVSVSTRKMFQPPIIRSFAGCGSETQRQESATLFLSTISPRTKPVK